jgi:hypothetical protein
MTEEINSSTPTEHFVTYTTDGEKNVTSLVSYDGKLSKARAAQKIVDSPANIVSDVSDVTLVSIKERDGSKAERSF